jgi:predicted aspartyl protease
LKYKYLVGMLALCGTATVARAETKCSISRIAELPVTMAGLRPEVRVKINGKDVVFLADSGAWYSMISPGSAAELGLKLQVLPPGYFNVGVGGSFVPKYTIVDSFTIAGVKIPRVEFLVGGSEFGTVGLLGQNVLAIEDTEFDLANGMIRLMRTRNCGKSPIVYWAGPEVNFSVVQTESMPTERPHIIAPIYINGIKLRALFDTGASSSFVSLKAAARAGLKPDTPGVTPAGVSSGLGRSLVSTWVGPVARFVIPDCGSGAIWTMSICWSVPISSCRTMSTGRTRRSACRSPSMAGTSSIFGIWGGTAKSMTLDLHRPRHRPIRRKRAPRRPRPVQRRPTRRGSAGAVRPDPCGAIFPAPLRTSIRR